MIAIDCPSRETLLQYSLGMLVGEQRDDLDRHLDGCPDCQATIVTLDDTDDTLIGRLRTPLSGESVLAEPQLQRAMATAMAMPARMPAAEEHAGPAGPPVSEMPEILGEYRLLEELGRGGMGRVYKAWHTKLDRVVALKVLPRGRVGNQKANVRFEREMKAVGRLVHPNIVQAHDAREIDGTPVLIMEFVDGLDLAEIVRRVGRLPAADACELVRQTALALQCAHEHGLVHRDIKPSNIMLSRAGEVKLLDLGLARFYAEDGASPGSEGEDMTGTGTAMGTAEYMAPEQASDSRTVDIRADLYSLGCTFYKLLSGRAPFGGPEYRTTLDKLNAHVHQPAPPVQQLVPDVPAGLSAILNRLLAKDPDDRFATPFEVAEALEPWCVGADLSALLRRAVDLSPRPLRAGQGEGNIQSPLPREAGQGEGEDQGEVSPAGQRVPAAKPPLLLSSWGWKWFAGQLILLMMAGGLGFALGIVIRIHKDGKETTVEVPEGGTAKIDANGQIDVTLPGQAKSVVQAQQSKESAVPDEKAVQGTWEVVGSTFKLVRPLPGEESIAPEQVLKTTKVIITADSLKIVGSHVTNLAFDCKLRPAAKPSTIDLESRDGAFWGIYQLAGNELKICTSRISRRGEPQRPSEFWAELGSGKELLVLCRVGDASLSADEKAILGTWRVERLVFPMENAYRCGFSARDQRVVFSPHTMKFADAHEQRVGGPDLMEEQGYALDPTDQPKRIDFVSRMMVTTHAIYELRGDQLTLAFPWSGRGDARPSKLAAGADTALVVLTRIAATAEPFTVEIQPASPVQADPLQSPHAADMRAILLAALEYATEHPQWPQTLDELKPKYLAAGKIDLGQFVYYPLSREMLDENPQELAVLTEKEPASADGRLVGFADGYVEFIKHQK